jgi:hypothetical protein
MNWIAKENEEGITVDVMGGEIQVQGIQAVMAEVEALPEAPKKERKRKDTITSRVSDPVNSPAHYTAGGIETIDFIKAKLTPEEFQGYLKGNIIKYTSRAGKKAEMVQDFEKGQWYMNRLVETLKGDV